MFISKKDFKALEKRVNRLEKGINQLNCNHQNIEFNFYSGNYIKVCNDCNKILKNFGLNKQTYLKEKSEYYRELSIQQYEESTKIMKVQDRNKVILHVGDEVKIVEETGVEGFLINDKVIVKDIMCDPYISVECHPDLNGCQVNIPAYCVEKIKNTGK